MPEATLRWQAPRDAVEARIATIWAGVLGHNRFGVGDSFFDVGGDSLQAVSMMGQLDKAFGRPVAIAWLLRDASVSGLAARFQDDTRSGFECLHPLAPAGPPPPVYLFPTNHGDLVAYRHLVKALRGRLSLYGFEPRGIDGESPTRRSVPAMAADYVRDLIRFQPNGPFVLLGFSFGGLVAFEAACVLDRMGRAPTSLALVDPLVGEAAQAHSAWRREVGLRARGWPDRARFLGKALRRRLERRTLHGVGRLYQRSGRRLPLRVRKPFFITVSARATRAYRPPIYHGDALLFCARADHVSRVWRQRIDGELERVVRDDDHNGMLSEDSAPGVAAELVRRFAPRAG